MKQRRQGLGWQHGRYEDEGEQTLTESRTVVKGTRGTEQEPMSCNMIPFGVNRKTYRRDTATDSCLTPSRVFRTMNILVSVILIEFRSRTSVCGIS
jgi:hypothetical protein